VGREKRAKVTKATAATPSRSRPTSLICGLQIVTVILNATTSCVCTSWKGPFELHIPCSLCSRRHIVFGRKTPNSALLLKMMMLTKCLSKITITATWGEAGASFRGLEALADEPEDPPVALGDTNGYHEGASGAYAAPELSATTIMNSPRGDTELVAQASQASESHAAHNHLPSENGAALRTGSSSSSPRGSVPEPSGLPVGANAHGSVNFSGSGNLDAGNESLSHWGNGSGGPHTIRQSGEGHPGSSEEEHANGVGPVVHNSVGGTGVPGEVSHGGAGMTATATSEGTGPSDSLSKLCSPSAASGGDMRFQTRNGSTSSNPGTSRGAGGLVDSAGGPDSEQSVVRMDSGTSNVGGTTNGTSTTGSTDDGTSSGTKGTEGDLSESAMKVMARLLEKDSSKEGMTDELREERVRAAVEKYNSPEYAHLSEVEKKRRIALSLAAKWNRGRKWTDG
jgi:hypothetical protein